MMGTLQINAQIFNASGSYTVPAGVKAIKIKAWGGGGSGGTRTTNGRAGGGGAGAYSYAEIPVTTGQVLNITVGNGGTNGSAGGDSYVTIGGTTYILAKGGDGVANNTTTRGLGGRANSGTGDTRTNGGDGTNGDTNGGNGGNSPSGGNGGLGSNANSDGADGIAPGGGGAGARRNGGSTKVGGAGGTGRVEMEVQYYWGSGSRDLYPAGVEGGRAYLRASTTQTITFPYPNLATHYVYAKVGERIALSSSAQSGTTNRIRLFRPNNTQVTLSFSTGNGNIPDRNGELDGPNLPTQTTGTTNRYTPIYYTVPAGGAGIYRVEFIGTNGSETTDTRMTYIAANANWTQATSSSYLAAWDISVAKQTGGIWNWEAGRTYTTVLNMDNPSYGGTTGSDNANFRPNSGFFGKFKVLTRDGYVYNVDNNGNQGISFSFMVNNRGFHMSGDPSTPSYKSILAGTAVAVTNRYHDPRSEDSGAAVTQKIFYSNPDSSMPVSSNGAVPGGNTWLRPVEKDLDIDDITVEGVEGSSNQLGNKGAYIMFYNESGGDYIIVIRPTSGSSFTPRILMGSTVVGNNKILWDGKDGDGNSIPTGLADLEVEVKLRGAEVHFPYIDMELNANGILLELLTKDLNSVRTDKVYWNDTDIPTVTIGSMSTPRNASHDIDPMGISSTTNGHKWGVGTTRTDGSFGDEKGMDTWTFVEGDFTMQNFEVVIKVSDLEIPSITPSKSYLKIGDEITYYIKAKNNGPSDAVGAPFSFIVPEGFTPKTISFNGNGCGTQNEALTYNAATRTYSSKLDLPDGCQAYYMITLDIGTGITVGQQDFTATIMRPNDVTDPDATNPDPLVPPTDPFYECDNNGLAVSCNNIKTSSINYNLICYDLIPGETFNWSFNAGTPSPITQTTIQPPTNAGFIFDIYELDNSFNMNINGVMLATQELEFQNNQGLTQNIRFADGSIWESGGIEDIWKLRGTTDKPIIRVEILANGDIFMLGSKVSATNPNYALEPLELIQGNTFNTITWNSTSNNTVVVTQNVVGITKMVGYGSGQDLVECETYTINKEGVFNDENGDGFAQLGETINYTITVVNAKDIDIYDVKVVDPLLGGEITVPYSGDLNNDGILNVNEEWVYTVLYTPTQVDIDNRGVYNLATVSGKNVLDEDLDPETSVDPNPLDPSDPKYDPLRPNHTFTPLKIRTLLITNPNIYQKVKKN